MPVDATPSRPPALAPLAGRFGHLERLAPAHAEALFPLVGPGHADLWTYLPDGPFDDPAAFAAYLGRQIATPDRWFYAICAPDRRPLGHASFLRPDAANRVIEVGSLLFSPALSRTPLATEAMYLMMRDAFERQGVRRLEWKCNALNAPSRRAAERLGFTHEGVFGQHMIVKGENRDSAWYAILDGRWPAVRAGFERWLAPDNFADGRQRRPLAGCRDP